MSLKYFREAVEKLSKENAIAFNPVVHTSTYPAIYKGGVLTSGGVKEAQNVEPGTGKHSDVWDRCVDDVKKKGGDVDPYAVCTTSLGHQSASPLSLIKKGGILSKQHFEADSGSAFAAQLRTQESRRKKAQEASSEQYMWRTMRDKKVRSMHAALEGQVFSYDDPPITNEDGDRNNPGEDYNCRCVGDPVE